MLKAPYSSDEDGPWQPNLAGLHLWRVQPSQESLHRIIRPSTGQKPIVMTATCMSGRKVVLGIWAVQEGEAIFVSVYDPKAIVTLEVTILCGWWAELELPPVKSMTTTDLDGLAAYVTQGISLQVPPRDHKGRVDMSKASLKFDPGPAPPLFEFGPTQFDSRPPGCSKSSAASWAKGRHVVWKGLRRFGRRAILLACARNGPSEMVVRGWDSSMAWRMTNVVTFYEEDWKTWNEPARPSSSSSTGTFSPNTDKWEPGTIGRAANTYQGNNNINNHRIAAPASRFRGTSSSSSSSNSSTSSSGTRKGTPKSARVSHHHWRPSLVPTSDTNQASTDRLCQDIADRVVMRREGKGGKTSLSTPHPAGVECGSEEGRTKRFRDEEEAGRDSGGPGSRGRRHGSTGLARGLGVGDSAPDTGKDAPVQRTFLSYKDMEQRMGELDRTETATPDDVGEGEPERLGSGLGPKRPPEAKDMLALTGANSMRAFIRRRGAERKTKSVNEIVNQLRKEAKIQEEIVAARRLVVVQQWKDLGKVLCRLLRMSDYWYGFASDQTLSSVERSARRISVLQQMVEMRSGGGGPTKMKTLVRAFAERYPRAVWSRFRQLMRQPKAQRCRRDMTVCAMLLSDIDNPFFRYTTAAWPNSRLVDLATDSRLVEKPPYAVLYEEGETAARVIGKDPLGPVLASNDTSSVGVDSSKRRTIGSTPHQATGETGGEQAKAGSRGTGSGLAKRPGRRRDRRGGEPEETWTVGAYVIMRGSVGLHVLERGAAANQPTVASQEDLAAKATRGQPMYLPRPPPEWEAAEEAVAVAAVTKDGVQSNRGDGGLPELRSRRQAMAEHLEASLLGSGAGPRRPRTRNVAPKWRACRLGPGALFGDRPATTGRLANNKSNGTDTSSSSNGDGSGSGNSVSRGDHPPNDTCHPSATPSSARSIPAMPGSATTASATPTSVKPAGNTENRASALETAVTVEPTELLEIGLGAYRKFLADGVKDKIDHAVAILRETGVMHGVPTPALERICRYATDHTASSSETSAMYTPLANPGAPVSGRHISGKKSSRVICRKGAVRGTAFFIAEGHGEVVIGGGRHHQQDSAEFPIESFFPNNAGGRRRRRRRRWYRSPSGDSVAGAVGNSCHFPGGVSPERSSGRYQDNRATHVGYPMLQEAQRVQEAHPVPETQSALSTAGLEKTPEIEPADLGRTDLGVGFPPTSQMSSLAMTSEASVERVLYGEGDEWQSGTGHRGVGSVAVAAVLKRGDFFGVAPMSPTVNQNTAQSAKQLNEQAGQTTNAHTEHFPPDNTKQLPLATTMVAAAAAVEVDEPETPAVAPKTAQSGEPEVSAMAFATARPSVTVTPEASVTTSKMASLSVTLTAETTSTASKITRSSVTATPDPPVVRGDASKSSAPAFAGFHTASLVAGPGGVKCLAVRLTVLQKVCPPVHARLKKAVAERYSGWIQEADQKIEEEWNELLSNESVKSLSSSFYEIFSKGNCASGRQRTGHNDESKSVDWASTDGGDSLSSIFAGAGGVGGVSEGLGGRDDTVSVEDRKTTARPTTCSTPSTAATSNLFDLGRRFKVLRLCSSVQTVIPVRLGRTLPCSPSASSPTYEPDAIDNDQACPRTPRWRTFKDSGFNDKAADVVRSPQSPWRGHGTINILSGGRFKGSRGGGIGGMFARSSARWKGRNIDRSHDAAETLRRGKKAMEQCCERPEVGEDGLSPDAGERQRGLWDCPVSPFSPPPLFEERPMSGLECPEEGDSPVRGAKEGKQGGSVAQTGAAEARVVLGEHTSGVPEKRSPRHISGTSSRGDVRPVEEIMHVYPTAPGRQQGSGWRLKRSRMISGRQKQGRQEPILDRIAKGETLNVFPQSF